jgi:hypothetical protein
MPDDERLTWDLLFKVLDVLERHGYHRRRPGGRTVTRHRTAEAQCTTGQTRRVTP